MAISLKLFTHGNSEPDIEAFVTNVKRIADTAGIELNIVDLAGEPIAAIHNHIHEIPTLVIEQEGVMPACRVGTAPFDLLQKTIMDRI
ncbi:hypothetical protein [Thalassobius sp. Cn5-15]|uniref:hypothetical protein n=1 Tax=Thalassobius sp. Cn5-15 TaxID=2917763 RepID=UPI001EF27865|nr:hypothetical protein [Thalassobius sp. Cn5-15]MCG7492485.1 hypothetical protein [Thalassobius sp. Cn5-15]